MNTPTTAVTKAKSLTELETIQNVQPPTGEQKRKAALIFEQTLGYSPRFVCIGNGLFVRSGRRVK